MISVREDALMRVRSLDEYLRYHHDANQKRTRLEDEKLLKFEKS